VSASLRIIEPNRWTTAQGPEQVLVVPLVALHHPPVGQRHLFRDYLVRCQPATAA